MSSRMASISSSSSSHIVVVPFMSKGHTIPILHLVRLLHRRNITITIFTTHKNSPFIREFLADTQVSVVDLSFPQHNVDPQLPPGVESTDKLPSVSHLFIPFLNATKLLQPEFDRVLRNLQNVCCIISDGFFPWTLQSASELGIPRLVFYGMSNFATSFYHIFTSAQQEQDSSHLGLVSDDEPFTVPSFPRIKLTKNDFEPEFQNPEPGPHTDFYTEEAIATANSQGFIVNSFYELEPEFVDYWNREASPKAWCVGPLCLVEAEPSKDDKVVQPLRKPIWIQWLDEMFMKGKSVLYVAFGSQEEMEADQLREIAVGLEQSEANFLWVVRSLSEEHEKSVLDDGGFEERVRGRGLVVREWVNQVEILKHQCIDGFMSHCGWNSVMESICASVPMLGFPITADQHLNARMVEDYLGIGVRVLARNGSVRGFVSSESVENKVRELMEGEKGKEARNKVKEVSEAARMAMEEGGSSCHSLDLLIYEICNGKKVNADTLS